MAKNENYFAKAEKMLGENIELMKKNDINFKEILSKTNADIQKLQTESDKAYLLGNIQLGDELNKEKNLLKERYAAIYHINEDEIRRKSAEENKDLSREYHTLVLKSLKESDTEDINEIRKHLELAMEISKAAVERKNKAANLLIAWQDKVCHFGYGESLTIYSDLADINRDLNKSGSIIQTINGNNQIVRN